MLNSDTMAHKPKDKKNKNRDWIAGEFKEFLRTQPQLNLGLLVENSMNGDDGELDPDRSEAVGTEGCDRGGEAGTVGPT